MATYPNWPASGTISTEKLIRSIWETYRANLINMDADVAALKSYNGFRYRWTDEAARLAQTGMVEGESGVQIDTGEAWFYTGSMWMTMGYLYRKDVDLEIDEGDFVGSNMVVQHEGLPTAGSPFVGTVNYRYKDGVTETIWVELETTNGGVPPVRPQFKIKVLSDSGMAGVLTAVATDSAATSYVLLQQPKAACSRAVAPYIGGDRRLYPQLNNVDNGLPVFHANTGLGFDLGYYDTTSDLTFDGTNLAIDGHNAAKLGTTTVDTLVKVDTDGLVQDGVSIASIPLNTNATVNYLQEVDANGDLKNGLLTSSVATKGSLTAEYLTKADASGVLQDGVAISSLATTGTLTPEYLLKADSSGVIQDAIAISSLARTGTLATDKLCYADASGDIQTSSLLTRGTGASSASYALNNSGKYGYYHSGDGIGFRTTTASTYYGYYADCTNGFVHGGDGTGFYTGSTKSGAIQAPNGGVRAKNTPYDWVFLLQDASYNITIGSQSGGFTMNTTNTTQNIQLYHSYYNSSNNTSFSVIIGCKSTNGSGFGILTDTFNYSTTGVQIVLSRNYSWNSYYPLAGAPNQFIILFYRM